MEQHCKVCLVAHDPEIHEATLRIHEWVREDLKRRLDFEPAPVRRRAKSQPAESSLSAWLESFELPDPALLAAFPSNEAVSAGCNRKW